MALMRDIYTLPIAFSPIAILGRIPSGFAAHYLRRRSIDVSTTNNQTGAQSVITARRRDYRLAHWRVYHTDSRSRNARNVIRSCFRARYRGTIDYDRDGKPYLAR